MYQKSNQQIKNRFSVEMKQKSRWERANEARV